MTHTSTEQPEALRLADAIDCGVPTPTKSEVSKELRRLHARVQELEKAESDLISERDRRDEIIDRMAAAVLGPDRHEWSSAYDLEDAAQEVEDAQRPPLDYHEIAMAHQHIGSYGQLEATERIVRWTERRLGITQGKQG